MSNSFDQSRLLEQEQCRGLILALLEAWGFGPCREDYLRRHVSIEMPQVITRDSFRNELSYLEGKELLTLDRQPTGWVIVLTSGGLDVAQHKVEVKGIQFVQ